jgi:HEAT repeat protein
MKKILIWCVVLLILVSLGAVSWIKVFGPISRLKDEDPSVRFQAVLDLPTSWVPDRFTRLSAALKDRDAGVSGAAARALVKFGEPAVEPLVAALQVEDLQVRGNVALELGKIGDPALEPLLDALHDEDVCLRRGAALAMHDVLRAIEDPEIRRRAVEPLIGALKDQDYHVRKWAPGGLMTIGEPAFEPLLGVLEDEDNDIKVRRDAAVTLQFVLRAIEDPETRRRAVEPLIRLLKKEGETEGLCYASGPLSKMGVLALEPLLGIMLEQDGRKGQNARAHAVSVLGLIVGTAEDPEIPRRVMAPLIDRLQDETKSAAVRRNAAHALGQILGGEDPQIIKRAIEALLTALESDSAVLCQHVARGLRRAFYAVAEPELERRAVKLLLAMLEDPNAMYEKGLPATQALGIIIPALKSPELAQTAVPPLIIALQDDRQCYRVHASLALGRIVSAVKDPELARKAVPPLIIALQDKDRYVRELAAESLGRIFSVITEPELAQKAIQPLLTALEDNTSLNTSVRNRAAWALVKIGTWQARGAVFNAGFDPDRPPSPPPFSDDWR